MHARLGIWGFGAHSHSLGLSEDDHEGWSKTLGEQWSDLPTRSAPSWSRTAGRVRIDPLHRPARRVAERLAVRLDRENCRARSAFQIHRSLRGFQAFTSA